MLVLWCAFALVKKWTLTFQEILLSCREELEKQKAHERYLKLQEQGKTEQSKKDLGEVISLNLDTWNGEGVPSISWIASLQSASVIDWNWGPAERLALIRQQRLEAAKKREEEKAGMFFLQYSHICVCLMFYA